jgi:mercuric ion binding protein
MNAVRLLVAGLALAANASWVASALRTVTLDVKNMDCALCPVTVRKALEKVPGVAKADVDFAARTAAVKYDPTVVTPAALQKATADAGYPSVARVSH